MSSGQGVVILKAAHHLIPDEFLEIVLKENPTCGGAALSTFDKEPTLFCDTFDKPDLKSFKDIQESFQDSTILFFAGNYPEGYLKEDRQPFNLLRDEKDKVLMVGFLEGDFEGFQKEGSKHSGEFFAANEYLAPKLSYLYGLVGNDMAKLIKELQSPVNIRDLRNTFEDRGTMILMPYTGDIITCSENPDEKEFSWGGTSKTYGYQEKTPEPVEAPPKEEEKEISEMEKKIAAFKARKAAEAAGTTVEPAKAVETKATEALRAPTFPPPDAKGELSSEELQWKHKLEKPAPGNRWAAPPLNSNNSNKKAWYNKRRTTLPSGWKDSVPIQVPITAMGAALAEAKAKSPLPTATAVPQTPLPSKVPDTLVPERPAEAPAKELEVPADVKAPNQPTEEGAPIPVLNPKLQRHIVDTHLKQAKVKAILDADGEDIVNPKSFQDIEKKFPDVIQQLGLNSWNQLYRLPFEEILSLCKIPQMGAVLAFWALHKVRSYELVAAQTETKDTAPKHVPAPATQAPPEAPRKSAFGRR